MAGNSTSAVVVVNALDARRIEFVEDAMKVWHEERRFPFRKPWVKFSKDENGNGVFKEVHFSKENFLEYYSTLKSTHFLSLQQVERLLYGENEDYTTYIVKIKCENAGDFVILEEHFPTWDKMLDNRYAIAKLNKNRAPVHNTLGNRNRKTRAVFNIGAASVCSDEEEVSCE